MRIAKLPEGEPIAHSGHGNRARRHVMLASTLERMPMGIQLFDPASRGIKLAVLDHPRRRVHGGAARCADRLETEMAVPRRACTSSVPKGSKSKSPNP